MQIVRLSVVFVLPLGTLAWGNALAQTPQTFTWSSSNCTTCESSVPSLGFYSDGSGLFMETIHGSAATAMVGMSVEEGNFIVAAIFSLENNEALSIDPREAMRLETDSASHMILEPLTDAGPGAPKAMVNKQFGDGPVALKPGGIVAGYLFFPADETASRITIVLRLGNEIFRFPFARDPQAHAKFGDPHTIVATEQVQTAASGQQEPGLGSPPCQKNISFAVAEGGRIVSRAPDFTQKWITKNRSKYPRLCFSQMPDANAANYVLIFSLSRSAFEGIYPTVQTSRSISTIPVSGSGTVSDDHGAVWSYTYNGTVTTTAETTTHADVPYTDTSNTLYLYSYNQRGGLLAERWRTITTRQGGDAANTLGYNLGAALGAIHFKERLLKDAVGDVVKAEPN